MRVTLTALIGCMDELVPLLLLFIAHGVCSVSLTLLNKSIAVSFPHPWTVISLQNGFVTLFVPLLHLLGLHRIQPLQRWAWLAVAVNAVWLVLVLWSSIKTFEFVSVPLYVTIRNTVPLQTMVIEYFGLGRPIGVFQISSLAVIFCGTLLYTTGDTTSGLKGLSFAFLNTFLVSSLAVYERGLMVRVKQELTPMMLNFYKVTLSIPLVIALQLYLEGGLGRYMELFAPERLLTLVMLAASAFFGFGVGTLVTSLVAQVSSTTIQVVNIFYKFLTTVMSRFTHPSDVALEGWVGYAICSTGFCMYTFAPKPMERMPRKEQKAT